MIQISESACIRKEAYNVVLEITREKNLLKGRGKGAKAGIAVDRYYYPTVRAALSGYVDKKVDDSSTVVEMLMTINELRSDYEKLAKELSLAKG